MDDERLYGKRMFKNPMALIFSCAQDRTNGRDAAVRDTWLQRWGSLLDYKFVYGRGVEPQFGDQISVDAGDSYGELGQKQRAAYRWFLDKGDHDFLFVCYTDTYVVVPRLLASEYWTHLYTGRRDEEGRLFAGGGMGYWLNHAAAAMLADLPSKPGLYSDEDDGYALAEHKILPWDDKRYGGDVVCGDGITKHLSRGTGNYDPRWMHDLHKQFLEGWNATVDAAV